MRSTYVSIVKKDIEGLRVLLERVEAKATALNCEGSVISLKHSAVRVEDLAEEFQAAREVFFDLLLLTNQLNESPPSKRSRPPAGTPVIHGQRSHLRVISCDTGGA